MPQPQSRPAESRLSDAGDMVIRRAHPSLGPFVRAYKGYAQGTDLPLRSRHVPTGGVALVIGLGSGFKITGPSTLVDVSAYRTNFVAGLHDTYSDSHWLGRSHGVQVDFTPIGAHLFFGLSMDTLSNRVLELDDLLGADVTCLVERLRETPAWDARFRIIEHFVISRLLEARNPSPEVVWAWQQLNGGRATPAIRTLAAELGWSQKRLIARFREQIGLPPKTAARVLRFNRTVLELERAPGGDWARIALDGGYFDQSHMIRDFREFAGTTPAELLALRRAGGDLSVA